MNASVAEVDAAARRGETAWSGGRMVWRAWGDGPPLVLLHGASGSWTHWLPAVRSRLSGIWGGRDAFAAPFLPARREVLARFQPDLDFRVVEGAGHWVPYERPREVDAAMLEMLAAPPAR